MRRFAVILAISIPFIISGCKKDDPLTPSQLLSGVTSAGKDWVLTSQTFNGTMTTIGSCVADDVTTFYSDLGYNFDEGATKCDPDDPQTIGGYWVLDEDNTHLLITSGSDVTDFEILELSEGVLMLKSTLLDWEVITTFNPL